jgi:metallophosphoesterase (TIGR00282 family)
MQINKDRIRVFLGGDVFGAVGMRCVTTLLPCLIRDEKIDFAIVNAENASTGIGVSAEDARLLLASGADVLSGGNHTFEKRDFWPVLDTLPEILRPANYPGPSAGGGLSGDSRKDSPAGSALPGRGAAIYNKNGLKFAVLNLQGREDMIPLDCPFHCAGVQISAWQAEPEPPFIFVDFHAESNQEKEAMGLYLAGRVVSVTGTHTHVQTADERILDGGTAYMSDLGMTGPARSVIGVDPGVAIKRNITQILYKLESANSAGALRGLIVEFDPESRKATGVRRIEIKEDVTDQLS